MASPTGTPVGHPSVDAGGRESMRRASRGSLLGHARAITEGAQVPKQNLAARAGHWSARHRKIAIGGWLAFVVIAFVLGGAVGHQDARRRGHRQRLLARRRPGASPRRLPGARPTSRSWFRPAAARPRRRPGVQGRRRRTSSARLKHTPHVIEVESPLAKGNEGQISKDGRSALVTFSIPGDADQSPTNASTPRSPRPPPRRRRIRTCASSSSVTRAPTRRSAQPGQ